jgi:chromosome segregation ATPase
MTDGEKIELLISKAAELDKSDALRILQLDNLTGQISAVNSKHEEAATVLVDLRLKHESEISRLNQEIALLNRELEQLKNNRDQTWQRFWHIAGAVISGTIVAAVAYATGFRR